MLGPITPCLRPDEGLEQSLGRDRQYHLQKLTCGCQRRDRICTIGLIHRVAELRHKLDKLIEALIGPVIFEPKRVLVFGQI